MEHFYVCNEGRWELMIDKTLVEHIQGASFIMCKPERKEIVLQNEFDWEGIHISGMSMVQDESEIRMYYRGFCDEKNHVNANCLAISNDGVNFEKPHLGLVEWKGDKNNNILLLGDYSLVPFIDENPDNQGSRYKAVNTAHTDIPLLDDQGVAQTDFLMGLVPKAAYSDDGLQWHVTEKIISNQFIGMAAFDTTNQAFFDKISNCYRMYARYWIKEEMFCEQQYRKFPISDIVKPQDENGPIYSYTRQTMSYESADFETWSKPVANVYAPWLPVEQLYTNTVRPIPGAEHILLCLSNRFHPKRMKVGHHPHPGTNDTIIMTSRNGVDWDRPFAESWIAGDFDLNNWTQRNHYVVTGMVTLRDEHVFYINEHYWSETARLRRLSLPRHRFASLHSSDIEGEVMTKVIVFEKGELHLNYATSATGSIKVSVVEPSGYPIKGYTFEECEDKFGNSLDEKYLWKSRKLMELAGKPVRLVFKLREADLFAFCIKD
jgi:hypothetical protein